VTTYLFVAKGGLHLAVLACDMALIGWELAATPPRPGDLLLFCARDQVRIYARAPGNAQENKDQATDACP
jgi:hypothetical protein